MKTAAIIGYGKSGKAAERLLKLDGYTDIAIFDDASGQPIAEFRDEYDCVVVSPGINLRRMVNAPKRYTSEIELAYKHLPEGAKIAAITGTNGKSTVTHLAAQIAEKLGMSSVACGNIGLTFADAVLDGAKDVYVVELSSFQTGMLREFSADVVVITNLAEDHMDRYADMDDYAADKVNLLKFLKPDGRLVIEDNEYLKGKSGIYQGEMIKVNPDLTEGRMQFVDFYIDTDSFPLSGKHNLLNLSLALLAIDGLKEMKGDMSQLVSDLTGLEHRCESVAEVNGVEYINDSKGTNLHSTLTALRGMPEGIIIILGGKDKNGDFNVLIDAINDKCSGVIAYGNAGEKIYSTLSGKVKPALFKAANLTEAVAKAAETAKAGEKVVLSPACASFDEHKSFEHRGRHFKELVEGLK